MPKVKIKTNIGSNSGLPMFMEGETPEVTDAICARLVALGWGEQLPDDPPAVMAFTAPPESEPVAEQSPPIAAPEKPIEQKRQPHKPLPHKPKSAKAEK